VILLVAFLAYTTICYAVGWFHADSTRWFRHQLPPATPRAIARVARRNRADLRLVLRPMPGLPAREVGVRVTSVRVVPPHELDRPRLGEPPSFLPDVEAFDREPTHG
jgi:hypothetical protein